MIDYYLAGPFFNAKERQNVETIARSLRNEGFSVYAPMEHDIEHGWDLSSNAWSKEVYSEDIEAIKNCRVVLAIIYGMTDDAGTSFEVGFAKALGKELHLVIMTPNVQSLMLLQAADLVLDENLNILKREQFIQK